MDHPGEDGSVGQSPTAAMYYYYYLRQIQRLVEVVDTELNGIVSRPTKHKPIDSNVDSACLMKMSIDSKLNSQVGRYRSIRWDVDSDT